MSNLQTMQFISLFWIFLFGLCITRDTLSQDVDEFEGRLFDFHNMKRELCQYCTAKFGFSWKKMLCNSICMNMMTNNNSAFGPGGAQPPGGGAQPPVGGAQPPVGGAQPPGGGAQPPGGGAQPPGGGAQPPGGGAQPPGGGAQPPGGGGG
ncbi:frizzled-8-like isoform X2 [Leptopilina heterotoma]|uniref:frizzled-8-like isoform X2 n=1 Tax=Leptopilina heterotoma TaxID=63436 RepID=UPI001CA80B8E|nr:frizzled-8-like isoform X2 [Leptopilina heterotoma]